MIVIYLAYFLFRGSMQNDRGISNEKYAFAAYRCVPMAHHVFLQFFLAHPV